MAEVLEFRVRDVVAALEQLKNVSSKRSINSAGSAGANVWLALARRKVRRKSGFLAKDIRIRRRHTYEEALFSVGTKKAKHAHLVELGTAPHEIPTPRGSPFSPLGGKIDHPGSRPLPFLLPSFHEGLSEAKKRIEKNLLRTIKKEAAIANSRTRGLR